MDTAMWIVCGVLTAIVILFLYFADWLARRYKKYHPPDDWDGMREDRDDEDS